MTAVASARAEVSSSARVEYILRLADTSLILAQRLGECVGHAPALEEDLGLGNLALDLLGQARLLLTHAGKLEGSNRSEDDLAYFRDAPQFRNFTLVEQPNVDFAHVIVRQLFVDAWQVPVFEALERSADAELAAIASKALKEAQYHRRFSGNWLVRLGDGTQESHRRVQEAVDALIRFTPEMFQPDAIDETNQRSGFGVDLEGVRDRWQADLSTVFARATLRLPAAPGGAPVGKRGDHSEQLGYVLAEMQHLQRAYPGASW